MVFVYYRIVFGIIVIALAAFFRFTSGMKILGPTRFHRLNEAGALVFLFAGLFFMLSLISYHPQDPSWNSVSGASARA